MSACTHEREVLLRLNAGGGGIQFRRYCMTCWRSSPAIPHARIKDPDSVPQADQQLIEQARDAWWRQQQRELFE